MLYSRPQLSLLLLLGAALLAGLAVREWRAGFPEAAARLESFDRVEPGAALEPTPLAGPARPPRSARPPRVSAVPGAPERAGLDRAAKAAPEPADPRPLDLNEASAEQLARLPGVGPGLARRIVEERQRRGRFEGPEGLRSVLGLGPRKLAALRDLVTAAP
jgi:competence ComEA-like helix-hairpin-helix protein